MTPKEKAKELVERFISFSMDNHIPKYALHNAKQCALICVEREYYSLREMLFSLRSSRVIESERVYLGRLDKLNELEKDVKQEINNL